MKKYMVPICLLIASLIGLMFTGCASDAQTGALGGAVVGGLIGQAVGGDTESTLIGAAVGGGAGYMIGNESDKKKAEREREAIRQQQEYGQQQINEMREEQSIVIVWVTNSNGSRIPVELRKTGDGRYVGPKGEYYDDMPSEVQLKKVYGF